MKRIDPRIRHVVEGLELTPRQTRIVELCAVGYATEEIADLLGMTYNTARTHLRMIYAELDVNGKTDLLCLILKGVLRVLPKASGKRRRR